jgi:hypothetical protein
MTSGGGTGDLAAEPNWWLRAVRSGTGQAIRWLAVLGLVVWRWAAGAPSGFSGWLPVLIIVVLLLLPDADTVAFGGVQLEMRRTREEVTGLREQVTNLQVAQAKATGIGALNLTTESPEVARVLTAAVGLVTQTAANEGTPIERYDPGAA